jgi:excisionase family DNA binding protein
MERLQYPGPKRVMTVREVAAYLSVHPTTIYRLLKRKQIPAFRIGSDWRFNIETINHWRRQQEKLGH